MAEKITIFSNHEFKFGQKIMARRFFKLSTTPLKIRQLPFGLNNLSKIGVSLLFQKSTKYVFYISHF